MTSIPSHPTCVNSWSPPFRPTTSVSHHFQERTNGEQGRFIYAVYPIPSLSFKVKKERKSVARQKGVSFPRRTRGTESKFHHAVHQVSAASPKFPIHFAAREPSGANKQLSRPHPQTSINVLHERSLPPETRDAENWNWMERHPVKGESFFPRTCYY